MDSSYRVAMVQAWCIAARVETQILLHNKTANVSYLQSRMQQNFLFPKGGQNGIMKNGNTIFSGGLIVVIKNRMMWVWSGLVLLSLLSLPCSAAQADPGAAQAPDQKVSEAAAQLTPVLDAILTQANESKVPGQKEISAAQAVLDSTKRYFAKMDSKQKAQYCLLQSWQSYYTGQLENAYANAVKAWKLDEASGDIWVTQVAMALVADKKPMLPRPGKKPARAQRNRQPGGMMVSHNFGRRRLVRN